MESTLTRDEQFKASIALQAPLDRPYTFTKGRTRMKRKFVKRKVYEFTPQELTVLEEALNVASIAARHDIETLNGADAATLEPHIARAHRFETLQRRVFRKR